MMEIKIIDDRLNEYDFSPQTQGSAGYDLRSSINESLEILPGEVKVVKTGIALRMNQVNLAAQILPRSGLGSRGLVLANGTGLIDSDYQEEIKVVLLNRTHDYVFTIEPMDRIAQMIFLNVQHPVISYVKDFTAETSRKGFGSTGVN